MASDPPADFAAKLKVAARLLGCRTRKEFCARFLAANPQSQFTPERLAKWMQGTARPREGGAYEELARLLGLKRNGTWVAEASPAAFEAEAMAATGQVRPPPPAATLPPGDHSHLRGEYHCLSPAWSPYFAGKWIRGRLLLETGPEGELGATYTERLMDRAVVFRGPVLATGRNLHLLLREAAGLTMLLTSYHPAAPASVICGVLAGATLVGPDMEPSSGRFIAVRLRRPLPGGPEGYAEALPATVTADLAAFGMAAPAALGRAVLAFLRGGSAAPDRVAWAEQTRLAALLDPLHLHDAPAAPRPQGLDRAG